MPANNNFKTTDKIVDNILAKLYTNLQVVQLAYRGFNKQDWANPMALGGTLRYRKPEYFKVVDKLDTSNSSDRSSIRQNEGILEIDKEASVHVDTNISQKTLDYSNLSEDRFVKQMARDLANRIESRVVEDVYKQTYITAGQSGSDLSKDGVFNLSGIVADTGIHLDNFYLGVPATQRAKLGAELSNFNNETFSGRALNKGWVGELASVNMFYSEFMGYHEAGAGGLETGSVSGDLPASTKECGQLASAISSTDTTPVTSVSLTNLPPSTTGVLKHGDILVLGFDSDARFFNENTKTKKTYYVQVAVSEDVDSDASGDATVPIYNKLYTQGEEQNVSQSIPENAYCAVYKSHPYGLGFRDEGIVFGMPKLKELTGGVVMSQREITGYGKGQMPISLSYGESADLATVNQIYKFMALYGVSANPRVMVRYIF